MADSVGLQLPAPAPLVVQTVRISAAATAVCYVHDGGEASGLRLLGISQGEAQAGAHGAKWDKRWIRGEPSPGTMRPFEEENDGGGTLQAHPAHHLAMVIQETGVHEQTSEVLQKMFAGSCKSSYSEGNSSAH